MKRVGSAGPATDAFAEYLGSAIEHALAEERLGRDGDELAWILGNTKRGPHANAKEMTPGHFILAFLFCVGSIRKKYERRMRPGLDGDSFWVKQQRLFRAGDAGRIARDEAAIWKEWDGDRCDLNERMVDAVLRVSKLVDSDWPGFQREFLSLPAGDLRDPAAWSETLRALDRLFMVGWALSRYLVRNLFGGPFFKPDLHILAIADHYFGGNLDAMGDASMALWRAACPPGQRRRLEHANIGVVDYVLWNYRRAYGVPFARGSKKRSPSSVPGGSNCRPDSGG